MMLSLEERSVTLTAASERKGELRRGGGGGHEGKFLSYALVDYGGVDDEARCHL